jgi:hypothetical protein
MSGKAEACPACGGRVTAAVGMILAPGDLITVGARFVLLPPDAARQVASLLTIAADEIAP